MNRTHGGGGEHELTMGSRKHPEAAEAGTDALRDRFHLPPLALSGVGRAFCDG